MAAATLRRGRRVLGGSRGARFRRHARVALVPCAHARQHHDGQQRGGGEPRDAALPGRKHDERGQQGTHRRPGIAAHLEERLRQPVLSAGSHARHARRFRMEHRRAHADQRHRAQNHGEGGRRCDQNQPDQGEGHAGRQRVRSRPAVGVESHQRLQQRRGELRGERDQADLAEIEVVGLLEQGIDGRDHRLHHVVQQMAKADRAQHAECGLCLLPGFGKHSS